MRIEVLQGSATFFISVSDEKHEIYFDWRSGQKVELYINGSSIGSSKARTFAAMH
jgi:hypothetical protein